mmetsp:Transcript_118080/g.329158  ORF Transcript_118080/g.329158 Transcript_118080/m.329158 type:complete len:641 (-) Transcript_118080:86-2008(-)
MASDSEGEERESVAVHHGLWETLQELELQEDPMEVGGMVEEVRQAVGGLVPSRKLELCSLGQARACGLARSASRGMAGSGEAEYGGRGEEEMDLIFVFNKVMERISKLERRVDKWNLEQQRRLDRVIGLHAGPATLRPCSAGLAPLSSRAGARDGSPPQRKRPARKREAAAAPDNQPEGEQSPKHGGADRNGHGECASPDPSSPDLQDADRTASPGGEPSGGAAKDFGQCSTGGVDSSPVPRKHSPPSRSLLAPVVSHPAFDCFFATMIFLNALLIGVQTEYRMRELGELPEPQVFSIAERAFAGVFFVELVMRMAAAKAAFFRVRALPWSLLDIALVLMSAIELFLALLSPGAEAANAGGIMGKTGRVLEMARIVRIVRVLRFLAELRLMVTSIVHSVRSLFWLMVLLLLTVYVFSIFFTQGVTDFLMDAAASPEPEVAHELAAYYGGLGSSAYTLFASITGGVSWAQVAAPLSYTGWAFTVLFVMYVFFCVFSVLNVVTAVFVDGTIQRSAQKRELGPEKRKELKEMYVSTLTELLEKIDAEGTGIISRLDLKEAFKNDSVRYSFSALDIDIVDSNYLFDMLDLDGCGAVCIEDFVAGCLRLKGNAKSLDIHTLMLEVKHLMGKMDLFLDTTEPPKSA